MIGFQNGQVNLVDSGKRCHVVIRCVKMASVGAGPCLAAAGSNTVFSSNRKAHLSDITIEKNSTHVVCDVGVFFLNLSEATWI